MPVTHLGDGVPLGPSTHNHLHLEHVPLGHTLGDELSEHLNAIQPVANRTDTNFIPVTANPPPVGLSLSSLPSYLKLPVRSETPG